VHGRWSDPAKDDTCTAWCREFWAATEPHATGEAYVNFLTEEESGRLRDAYGSSFERLVEVKNAWDPDNLFRMNHNVQPTA